jgi:hypothetical protein
VLLFVLVSFNECSSDPIWLLALPTCPTEWFAHLGGI